MLTDTIIIWRLDLNRLLLYYKNKKSQIEHYFIYLFLFFVILNISCYWFAMITAFPNLVFGSTFGYYFKIQFPVGILGALFDSLSFFITIYIIQKALKTTNDRVYIAHLSIDVLIAILATFWVLLVFIVSGWIRNSNNFIWCKNCLCFITPSINDLFIEQLNIPLSQIYKLIDIVLYYPQE